MSDKPREKRKGGGSLVVLVVGLVLLLLVPLGYFASYGPARAMVNRDQLSFELYRTIYRPVQSLESRSETVAAWLDPYCGWWDEHWLGESVESQLQ